MYIIKTHYVASKRRKYGLKEWDNYMGKGRRPLGSISRFPHEWEIKEFGYKNKKSAENALEEVKMRIRFKGSFSSITAEIIDCDIN